MPNNKFNTNTKTKDWFPFAKYLFKTEHHPIRQSKVKCSSAVETLLSPQEVQMLEGLTNSFQCTERECIRIVLYEASRSPSKAHEAAFRKANRESKERGHTARSARRRWNLPKTEKDEACLAAKDLKISDKEFLRLAIIWLAKGIKDESIIRLTQSPRIPKDEVAMTWSRENQGKPQSEAVSKLKEARDKAYDEAQKRGIEQDERLYAERGRMMDLIRDEGLGNVYSQFAPTGQTVNGHPKQKMDLQTVDALLQIEQLEIIEKADEEANEDHMDELEREIFRTMLSMPEGVSDDIIEEIAKETIKERKEQKEFKDFLENSSDEMMIDYDNCLFWSLRTPFAPYEIELRVTTESDLLRQEGESAQDYVLRLLPKKYIDQWNAYCSKPLQ